MVHKTPFHERTSALNETGLWQHWSGHVVVTRYQASGQVRVLRRPQQRGHLRHLAALQVPDRGRDAERFLSGMLARDIAAAPGLAHYTTWLDERGFVLEDGVIQHRAPDEFLLTSAEPASPGSPTASSG